MPAEPFSPYDLALPSLLFLLRSLSLAYCDDDQRWRSELLCGGRRGGSGEIPPYSFRKVVPGEDPHWLLPDVDPREAVCLDLRIPEGYKVRLPYEGETPSSSTAEAVCFLTDHFRYTLLLPLPSFFVEFLYDTGFVPAMLASNALVLILPAHELFDREDIPWTTSSFFYLYRAYNDDDFISFKTRLSNFSLTGISSSNSGWKTRYLFISHPDVGTFDITPTAVLADMFKVPSGHVSP